MANRVVFTTLYSGMLLTVTGALAWITGRAFIFPSLGPSAFLMATLRQGEAVTGRRVIGGHFIGVVAGLVAYHAIASGYQVAPVTAVFDAGQLRLVTSGIVAVMLTTAGMLATETVHPPACATTLIVSLGLLSSLVDAGLIVLSICIVFGVHRAVMFTRTLDD